MNYLAVNIGGTTCSIGLVDREGTILKSEAFPTGEAPATLERLIVLARNMINAETAAIGIACGGPLDEKKGLILSPPNLPGWDAVPVTSRFRNVAGLPCYLMNDANAGVLAEWYLAEKCQCNSLIFLTCGTGMGAGMILNGRLYEGANGAAGEIGHVRLTHGGPVGYHKKGSIEGWCSGNGFLQYAGCTFKEAAQALHQGHKKCRKHIKTFAQHLGQTLAILIDTINPDKIVLGGIFLRMENELRGGMEAVLRSECLPESLAACRITKATSGENIGLHAAMAVARYRSGVDPVDRLIVRYPEMAVCRHDLEAMIRLLGDAFVAGNKLLICGNGGSAADAEHIAGELLKSFVHPRPLQEKWAASLPEKVQGLLQAGLPVIVLRGGGAFGTAFANDVCPAHVYAQETHVLGRKDDVFLGISTSGNSENVLVAAQTAKAKGLKVIGMTGRKGGDLAAICDICLRVTADETFLVQELHLPAYHALCMALENRFFK